MNNETVIRTCRVCTQPYIGGTYALHQQTHPRRITAQQARIRALLAEGHTQSEVARIVGVSRQRIYEVVQATKGVA